MHGIFLAFMASNSASTFQLTGKAESQKYKGKDDLQKCRNKELYDIYNGAFQKNFSFSK